MSQPEDASAMQTISMQVPITLVYGRSVAIIPCAFESLVLAIIALLVAILYALPANCIDLIVSGFETVENGSYQR